jgi:hypothetical protein
MRTICLSRNFDSFEMEIVFGVWAGEQIQNLQQLLELELKLRVPATVETDSLLMMTSMVVRREFVAIRRSVLW